MTHTHISIHNEAFLINGKLTYSEIPTSPSNVHGLLMNARFIQGVFDDKADPTRFARFGHPQFDPEKNTDDLISVLPAWYASGLRAFTVGFQGGGPCFTISNDTIENNPFGEDGQKIDPAYAARMDRLIRGADAGGMVVIVSFFYADQAARLRDETAVLNATKSAANFLRDGGYTNVLIEIANEYSLAEFGCHPIIQSPLGMVKLLELARKESGGLAVGSSGGGGHADQEVCAASDYILIHGNGCTRQRLYNLILKVRKWAPNKPVLCNEDSQAIGQLDVAYKTQTSWGYYNNMTKQEPPANWGITPGEDTFFAQRMATGLGIEAPPIPAAEQYYLQGLEPNMTYNGKRWLRVASLYPEKINFVDFYRNDQLIYTAYDEPFSLFYKSNWLQAGCPAHLDDQFMALVHLRTGNKIELGVRK
jgi:hypothetical protein